MDVIALTQRHLGNEIREGRRRIGLTKEQLAAKAGARQCTVFDIENAGNARLDTVMRLPAALDLEFTLRAHQRLRQGH